MNNTKKIIGALLVTAVVGTSIAAAQTSQSTHAQGKTRIPAADHQKLMSLVESGDFAGWKALMVQDGLSKAADQVTADKFAKMTELANEMVKVEALRKEIGPMPGLGFGPEKMGKGEGKGMMMHGKGPMMKSVFDKLPADAQAKLKTALENHDKAAVDQILKDNGITIPQPPAMNQGSNVNSASTTLQQ